MVVRCTADDVIKYCDRPERCCDECDVGYDNCKGDCYKFRQRCCSCHGCVYAVENDKKFWWDEER
jgi:hypothetical protein